MATTEVAEVLEALDSLQEVNVYGVTVPGAWSWQAGRCPACHIEPCYLKVAMEGGADGTASRQGTRAAPGWQPWFCVPPTPWTWCSSTPMCLSTCPLMPGLDSYGCR